MCGVSSPTSNSFYPGSITIRVLNTNSGCPLLLTSGAYVTTFDVYLTGKLYLSKIVVKKKKKTFRAAWGGVTWRSWMIILVQQSQGFPEDTDIHVCLIHYVKKGFFLAKIAIGASEGSVNTSTPVNDRKYLHSCLCQHSHSTHIIREGCNNFTSQIYRIP